MARIDNPYIVGTPIPGSSYFYGRESLLKFVRDTLNPPLQRVVVLYGQRRIGKTSLLLELQRRLTEDYHPVYFDLMGQANRPLNLALYEIAEQIAVTIGLDLPNEFQEPRQFRSFLESVFDRLGNRPLLLLLDEFDDLSDEERVRPNAAALSLFDYLRDLLNIDLPIGFIFVVGRRLTELPQNFQSILKQAPSRKVGYLNDSDARQLIIEPAQGRLQYSEGAIRSIISLTSGHPYFMQLICFELHRMRDRHENPEITSHDVEWVIESAIETGQGGLSWFWDALPPAERFVMSAIAEAGGESGAATTEAFNRVLEKHKLHFLGLEVTNAPALLVKWEILHQTSTGYRFSVDLVRRWVKAEHPVSKAMLDVEDIIPRAKRYFENALDAHRSGELELAIEDYKRAINANPNHFRANMGLAQAFEEKNDLQDALGFYQQAYELDPDSARSSLAKVNDKLAHTLERDGQLQEAITKFERANEIVDSPTRQIHLDEIRAAIDNQQEKKEQWFRRIRYWVTFSVALIVLIVLVMVSIPYLLEFVQSANPANAVPVADPGEIQIIITQFDSGDMEDLAPEEGFIFKLSNEFNDVLFEYDPSGIPVTYEEAVMLAEESDSAAVLVGNYSSGSIEAALIFRNGVEFKFDRGAQFNPRARLDGNDVEEFVNLAIDEMYSEELIRLAEAIVNNQDGLTNFLSGQILLKNHDDLYSAEIFFNEAIAVNVFEAPVTWQPSLGIDVIYVPAGGFERGRHFDEMVALCGNYNEDCLAKVQVSDPVQEVVTKHFILDAYEVSNGQFLDCVEANVCDWPNDSGSSTRSDYFTNVEFTYHPVLNVSWDNAAHYCGAWRNGRLPTEAEWEKAARWDPLDGSKIYPWGDASPDTTLANYDKNNEDTVEVGSYTHNALGAYDMAGNVWEWVNDWYQPEYSSETNNPQGPQAETGERVLRGGAHYTQNFGLTVVDPALHTGHDPSGNVVTGFRCAYDEVPAP